jgi:hypothetical protein
VQVNLIAGTSGLHWPEWSPPVPFPCVVEKRNVCQSPLDGRRILQGQSRIERRLGHQARPYVSLRRCWLRRMRVTAIRATLPPPKLQAHSRMRWCQPNFPRPLPGLGRRMFALGTPSDASLIRDRAHSTTLSPTGPDSPRVALISPYPGSSVPHLVKVKSLRVTVTSPFAGMSSPHLVDVYSPRVTLVSLPFPGCLCHTLRMKIAHCIIKDDNMVLKSSQNLHM